ncbi:lipase family protein [Amycolatopsis sp. H20-H5]|uniref:lipase family protein n=1 Tax=Amycolatopsis sp. H20-H5 TaxID=3046309 RepID=UPI002DBF5643|nr:lipase family protein [Amycolatopsis sp. H20-H5]MEC3980740.1 lipase family protein [Amycolatopsis sp. H20-H5]
MTRSKRTLIGVLLLTLVVGGAVPAAAASAPPSSAGEVVLPPGQDPFYVPPAGFESSPNGTVLRSRTVTTVAFVLPLPVHSYQVLYKSLDNHGKPVAEAATVLVPLNPWTGPGTRPLVSYQLAEDSLSTRCQPSYTLRVGLGAPTVAATYEMTLSLAALLKGYAVVYADYEGPHSDFVSGPQAAHAILDGVRAAQQYPPTGLSGATPVGLWGYSGGGIATTWAAEQQASYAPELNVVGSAAGGVPVDLKRMLNHNDGNLGAGLGLLGFVGLVRAFPESGAMSLLNDKGRRFFTDNADACTLDIALFHPFDHLANYTKVANPAETPEAAYLFKTNNAGQATPRAPFYNYQGLADEFVPYQPADQLLRQYCADGATVQKSRIPFAGHITGEAAGQQAALDYLGDRFAGKPAPNDCSAILRG